ncbi:four helix bundle protein [Flagellimonas pacifica]|uniref:Four helix bundle protein n=1 Tax=Flagellimonas pacifica TaxID=1247520 RepID=A0A285MD84_9FLAO|nr:four helix bundle protein [Allomuricauda parva]SNY95135.1 four helix bundle protein [Allomuricauda parva]
MEKGFEQIISWKKSRELNKEVYVLTERALFSKDFALRDQMRRASISISSNIAEGYGRKTKKEFIYFLNVAQASCYEVKSQLYLALDINYLDKVEFEKVYGICDEISKTIYGLIKHLENKT